MIGLLSKAWEVLRCAIWGHVYVPIYYSWNGRHTRRMCLDCGSKQ